jgi:hypothetical protein
MKIQNMRISSILFIFALTIAFISCSGEKSDAKKANDETKNTEIDNKYIEYLSNYHSTYSPEIKFVTLDSTTYWVTKNHGSGNEEEIFWMLNKNQLVPVFVFDYHGENWEKELNYTFINIIKKDTISGNVTGDCEKEIEVLKRQYVLGNVKNSINKTEIALKLTFNFSDEEGNEKNGKEKEFKNNTLYTFCYDSESFNKLVISGDAKNLNLEIKEDNKIIFQKENFEIIDKMSFSSNEINIGGGAQKYKVTLKKNETVLFNGNIVSEGCR